MICLKDELKVRLVSCIVCIINPKNKYLPVHFQILCLRGLLPACDEKEKHELSMDGPVKTQATGS